MSDNPTTQAVVEKIVDESDYLGEAAERIAVALGISFGDAIALVEDEDAKNDA